MARVKPSHIERPKKLGRCGENIHDLDYIMAKKEYVNAPQADAVQTSQEPVIPNPLVPRPAIGTINHPMTILQSDGTDKYLLLPTQQTIYAEAADGSSKYVPVWASDVRTHRQSTFKTIIEMLPPGSICKLYLDNIDAFQALIHRIEFSADDYLGPALHIEFFKLKDVLAMPAEASPDTLSQYMNIESCVIYNLGQIEVIDSSDVAEMYRELIKNEMLAIKKYIATLKDNLRRLSRLKNSGVSTSGLVSEIHRKYQALVQSLEQKSFMK